MSTAPSDELGRQRRSMQTIDSPALMQAAAMALRQSQATIGFVPTMGALHEAHLKLMDEARRRCDVLVVSVFVNPKQFDRADDLQAYPHNLAADQLKCSAAGVDILFAPTAARMYPVGFDSTVHVDRLSQGLCGRSRPGHFDGMGTVVTKLFNIIRPHFAMFGEKDFQQLQIVRRMVQDLCIPVEILAMPVLREVDGLAMSSRNSRLNAAQRPQASALYRAIEAAQRLVERGELDSQVLIDAARAEFKKRSDIREDYVAIVDPHSLQATKQLKQAARILIAAYLGEVRLIDNGPLVPMA